MSRFINRDGYVMVWAPKHPRANSTGYIREHRLVAEAMLGRPLLPTEHVHHLNKDRADNRPANLAVLNAADHNRAHHARAVLGWSRQHPACVKCGTTERRHRAHGLCTQCREDERYEAKGRPLGAANHATKLSEDDVRAIRSRYAAGEKQAALAAAFGIKQGTVSSIIRRVTWSHIL